MPAAPSDLAQRLAACGLRPSAAAAGGAHAAARGAGRLIPILSDARGVQLIVMKWARKKRLTDAIVIEPPRVAGGHLGAARVADLNDPRFDFHNVLPQSRVFLHAAGIEKDIPLIAAGGIRSFEDIARLQSLGAAAVQLAAALRGDVKKGLFFRGAGALPFGPQIRSVRDLLERLLTPSAAWAG